MTKTNTFLIKATSGRECVMRLPINQHGGITTKGFKLVNSRFYDGTTETHHSLQYALNLETLSNGHDIIKAIEKYYKNQI